MRTLVVGDIHGNYKAFLQALERSGFDDKTDTLISLGDVVDGHCDSFEVVEKLTQIDRLISIKGNHDDWFNTWIQTGTNPTNWMQGQKATGLSYLEKSRPGTEWYEYISMPGSGQVFFHSIKISDIPEQHKLFFANQLPYYIDAQNRLFVHGGFNRHYPIEEQEEILWWDRDLWSQALSYKAMIGNPKPDGTVFMPPFKMVGDFKEVFIGHTSTQFWGEIEPMNAANIWNLDTGGGWFGRVTIMDVDTKEFWQSDDTSTLYPNFKGR